MTPSPRIAELNTVQLPLLRHAEAVGWECVSKDASIGKRRGVEGLFHYAELKTALLSLNSGVVTEENVQAIIQELEALAPTLTGNREMLEWLRGAKTVAVPEERRRRNVALVDFDDADRNVFQVTYEWEFTPRSRKGNRADVVFLVNGIPIAIVENKNPKLADAMDRAVKQFRRYELETPEMLTAPQVFNVTHLIHYLYGVTWNYARKNIFEWKEQRSETFEAAVQSFFRKPTLLRMLKDWILFYEKDDELQKTILRQHQTRAAVKVVERCADPKKHRGLVWHTQGSGKTFTLITAARLMLEDRERFAGATVLLVVDRNELEGQLSGWVERLVGEMRGSGMAIEYADSKATLQGLLDRDFRGLILSMIHKFDDIRADSCTRSDFYVLIDEAHRSTGGDLGNYLMGALPNATLIGFTGTPIDKTAQGRGTFKTFGTQDPEGYLDKYSIKESIEDGTTLKLRHTLAPGEIALPDEMLDKEFLALAETEGVSDIDELNRILDRAVRLKTFLKADDRVDKVARFVAEHFKESVAPLGYKAFLVAVDREACAKYKEALDRYLPAEMTAAVYTKTSLDALDRPLVARYQLDETREKEIREAFKKSGAHPQILIVTDKLLTGYDAPILYCMYLDKPMRDHVLLQAVARVNRPYEDEDGRKKPCGLVIDFVSILKELNRAFSFDSNEVSGVIEDLDVLLARFRELMGEPAARYLDAGEGTPDQQLERQLYERFLDPDKRRAFFEYFQEVETLYEILSPDPALREHVPTYQRLADLYAALRSEYGTRGPLLSSALGHKTEKLLQDRVQVAGDISIGRSVEYDAKTLESMRKNPTTDNGKIMNLLRDLRAHTEAEAVANPALKGLFERAQSVTVQFQDRQLSTIQVLNEIEKLQAEQAKAEQERTKLGLDAPTFGVYWLLEQAGVSGARELAIEVNAVFARFPNYSRSAGEMRQLKAEVYKALLKELSGKRMVELGDRIISARVS
jgi:type I restriction enzyme R subunit